MASPKIDLVRREKKDAMVVVFVEGLSGVVAIGDFGDAGWRKCSAGRRAAAAAAAAVATRSAASAVEQGGIVGVRGYLETRPTTNPGLDMFLIA